MNIHQSGGELLCRMHLDTFVFLDDTFSLQSWRKITWVAGGGLGTVHADRKLWGGNILPARWGRGETSCHPPTPKASDLDPRCERLSCQRTGRHLMSVLNQVTVSSKLLELLSHCGDAESAFAVIFLYVVYNLTISASFILVVHISKRSARSRDASILCNFDRPFKLFTFIYKYLNQINTDISSDPSL